MACGPLASCMRGGRPCRPMSRVPSRECHSLSVAGLHENLTYRARRGGDESDSASSRRRGKGAHHVQENAEDPQDGLSESSGHRRAQAERGGQLLRGLPTPAGRRPALAAGGARHRLPTQSRAAAHLHPDRIGRTCSGDRAGHGRPLHRRLHGDEQALFLRDGRAESRFSAVNPPRSGLRFPLRQGVGLRDAVGHRGSDHVG